MTSVYIKNVSFSAFLVNFWVIRDAIYLKTERKGCLRPAISIFLVFACMRGYFKCIVPIIFKVPLWHFLILQVWRILRKTVYARLSVRAQKINILTQVLCKYKFFFNFLMHFSDRAGQFNSGTFLPQVYLSSHNKSEQSSLSSFKVKILHFYMLLFFFIFSFLSLSWNRNLAKMF